jgi:threonine dehydrogenase-like Zn-dependent dehydrogenase
MHGRGRRSRKEIPDPTIQAPTDTLVRVTLACVCGSDLHP